MKTLRSKNLNPNRLPGAWCIAIIFAVGLIVALALNQPNSSNNTEDTSPSHTQTESDAPSQKHSPSSSPDNTDTVNSAQPSTITPAPNPDPNPQSTSTPSSSSTPQPTQYRCYHEEAGHCWDDLEDEAYSAGLYDHMYGSYGASFDYPDDCDSVCHDILEDAYREGWIDANY